MELDVTSDTGGSFMYESRSEVADAFRVVEAKYREVDLDICALRTWLLARIHISRESV